MSEKVVNYDAWKAGYTPPTEHILIDQLAYRGARVIMMSDWGDDGAYWIVTRGKILSPAVRKQIRLALEMMEADEDNISQQATA